MDWIWCAVETWSSELCINRRSAILPTYVLRFVDMYKHFIDTYTLQIYILEVSYNAHYSNYFIFGRYYAQIHLITSVGYDAVKYFDYIYSIRFICRQNYIWMCTYTLIMKRIRLTSTQGNRFLNVLGIRN